MSNTLQFKVEDDGVAVVTIDVPGSSANVMNDAFRSDLAAAIDRVTNDSAIRGAVLTSGKSDFMAGGDLKAMVEMFAIKLSAREAFDIASQMSPLLRKLETCGKPFAAAINGAALGGGLELCLACHYRVAADNPKLVVGLPEATLGLMPGAGGTQRLPRLIGIQKAFALMSKGTRLSAREALEAGIVHAVVPSEELVAVARSWIVAQGDPQQPWDIKGYKVPGGAGFFDSDLANFFNLSATAIARDTQRNYPAPIALLTAVARGTAVPIDAGLHIESCQFAKLIMDPVACSMARTLFVSKGELDKLSRRPRDIAEFKPARIGVIGAGLMGTGIAQVAALAGLDVTLIDASLAQAELGKTRLADAFAKQIQRGRMRQEKAEAILLRIQPSDDYASLSDCDLVVEAVFEDRKVKADVFAKVKRFLKPGAILASNTSTLPITGLASGVEQSDRFIGLHFFSPVDRMALVEVIVGESTSQTTLAHALDFIKLLRKTPIIVKDSRGFFTSRVISTYLSEAMSMVSGGVLPALIDNAAKQAGFPIGPLSLIDDIGLEVGYAAMKQEREDLGAEWVEPAGFKVQRRFCDELDRKGRRAGKGFYDYPNGQRALWSGLTDVYSPLPEQPEVQELKTRMLYIQALEAARCFEEGVISDAGEGDVGSVMGIGFPSYTGGVFSLIDTVSPAVFVDTCDRLAEQFGERFRPSAWLRERAREGTLFHPIPSRPALV
ncbi:enoyl-CoA hydratase/isomerase family protein [Burkholderia sp. R-69980]|nr:enoyl-CoA hydratase/isomerase family protein [Burkholderia sp. R-69980]